jgi:hypothetical protein
MCCNSAPDTSGINAAAQANANVAQQALDWYKSQYADQAPLRAQASATAQKVSDAQLAAMGVATDQARHDQEYRQQVYEPLERGIVSDAQNYDTLDRRDEAAGKAIGDVMQQEAAQKAIAGRDLARMGVNPADGAYADMERSASTNAALGAAAGANRAREQVRTTGLAMREDAANLGRGLSSSQATQAGLALNAGNAAAANGVTPVQLAQQGTSMVGQGFQTAIQGNQSSGNLYGTAANIQNQADANENALWGGIGGAAGSFMGSGGLKLISDENEKEDIKPASSDKALEAVEKTPVKSWKYKPTSAANDGGVEHTGPMAQDVQKNMGSGAAPGGKVIDLIKLNGINMAAIQGLSKKVDKIAARIGARG